MACIYLGAGGVGDMEGVSSTLVQHADVVLGAGHLLEEHLHVAPQPGQHAGLVSCPLRQALYPVLLLRHLGLLQQVGWKSDPLNRMLSPPSILPTPYLSHPHHSSPSGGS